MMEIPFTRNELIHLVRLIRVIKKRKLIPPGIKPKRPRKNNNRRRGKQRKPGKSDGRGGRGGAQSFIRWSIKSASRPMNSICTPVSASAAASSPM